jgi:hypothetical protein
VFLCSKKQISLDHLSGSASFLLFYGWFKTRKLHHSGTPFKDKEGQRAYEMTLLLIDNNAVGVMFTFRSQCQLEE